MSDTWQRIPLPFKPGQAHWWFFQRTRGEFIEVVKWDYHLQRWTAQRRIGKVDCIAGMATTSDEAKEILG